MKIQQEDLDILGKVLSECFSERFDENYMVTAYYILKMLLNADMENRPVSFTNFSLCEIFKAEKHRFRSMHNRLEINLGKNVENIISRMIDDKNPSAIDVLFYGLKNVEL